MRCRRVYKKRQSISPSIIGTKMSNPDFKKTPKNKPIKKGKK